MIRKSDRYWSVLLTDIIIVDVIMEEVLRVDGKQGYERVTYTCLAEWHASMFYCEP